MNKPPMLSKDVLYDLYINKRMTSIEIAKMVGTKSPQTILNWLRKYDIPIRDVKSAQRAIIPTKEELDALYTMQQLSIDTVARTLGSSEIAVSRLLKEYGIPIRDRTEKCSGWNKGMSLPEQQRQHLSKVAKERVGEKSPRYGAKLTEKTRNQIAGSLKGRFRRHLHPNWKNGGIKAYRQVVMGQYEYNDWRKTVFKRDNYTCQMCNKPSNGDIQAHHICPVSKCPERIIDVTNGITLCKRCHESIKNKEDAYAAQFEAIVHSHPPIL